MCIYKLVYYDSNQTLHNQKIEQRNKTNGLTEKNPRERESEKACKASLSL